MPVPKQRHNTSRRNRRRNHNVKTSTITVQTCSNCGEKKLPHRACAACGTYKGRTVVEKKEKASK